MRKFVISIFVFTYAFVPLLVSAQNWTPEEQAILDKVKLGWTSWDEAVEKKDLSIWLEQANPMEERWVWFTSRPGPQNLDVAKNNFDFISSDYTDSKTILITPLRIEVHDDIGFIWFYANGISMDSKGIKYTRQDKRFEVYKKVNGEWRWWAGMVVSDED